MTSYKMLLIAGTRGFTQGRPCAEEVVFHVCSESVESTQWLGPQRKPEEPISVLRVPASLTFDRGL